MLHFDLINFIITIINLLILYAILRKFLIHPVTEIMEKRTNLIQDQFLKAQEVNDQANAALQTYETKLQVAKEEAERILQQSREQAQKEYQDMMEQAKERIEKMQEREKDNMEQERVKLYQEMKSQITSLAMTAAAKILEETGEQQRGSGR